MCPCDGYPKVYIGQTGRSLKHRLAEHRRALKNDDVAASALAEHTLATGHPVALTKAEVIEHNITAFLLTSKQTLAVQPLPQAAVTLITGIPTSITIFHTFMTA